jgi:hypothetical protein
MKFSDSYSFIAISDMEITGKDIIRNRKNMFFSPDDIINEK